MAVDVHILYVFGLYNVPCAQGPLYLLKHKLQLGSASSISWGQQYLTESRVEREKPLPMLSVQHGYKAHHAASVPGWSWGTATTPGQEVTWTLHLYIAIIQNALCLKCYIWCLRCRERSRQETSCSTWRTETSPTSWWRLTPISSRPGELSKKLECVGNVIFM